MSQTIIIQNDLYKRHFSINLVNDVRMVSGKQGFKNPVKALAYVEELKAQGHTVFNQDAYNILKAQSDLYNISANPFLG